jgi:RNA polymerase sigma factor (TIGR02999 family)
MPEVNKLLEDGCVADARTADRLFPQIYEALKRAAHVQLLQERKDHTLSATALVHEVYLRLTKNDRSRQWVDQNHFYAVAAEAMRRILVDCARRKAAFKRGGAHQRLSR